MKLSLKFWLDNIRTVDVKNWSQFHLSIPKEMKIYLRLASYERKIGLNRIIDALSIDLDTKIFFCKIVTSYI